MSDERIAELAAELAALRAVRRKERKRAYQRAYDQKPEVKASDKLRRIARIEARATGGNVDEIFARLLGEEAAE